MRQIFIRIHSGDFDSFDFGETLLQAIYGSGFCGNASSTDIHRERACLVARSMVDWRVHNPGASAVSLKHLTSPRLFDPLLMNRILRMLEVCPYLLCDHHEYARYMRRILTCCF